MYVTFNDTVSMSCDTTTSWTTNKSSSFQLPPGSGDPTKFIISRQSPPIDISWQSPINIKKNEVTIEEVYHSL